MSGASQRLWAGLDIGGSKVHAVALDDDGGVLAEHRLPTRGGRAGVLATAGEALTRVAAAAGTTATGFAAVGVGVPGLVEPGAGGVRHAVNLGLAGEALALREGLTALAGAPVTVENDVNAAALGAARVLGPAAGAQPDLAYLSIGTGLAAGLVLGGRLRRGASGAAGEIGHVPLDPAGPPCPCGQRGCLEVSASGAAIARSWPARDGVPAAQELFDAADAGDPRAAAVRDGVLAHVAVAVRLLALTVDVELVVLGGGVAELGERLAAPVRDHLEHLARGSAFLRSLDLPARVVTTPAETPVAALGAALAGRAEALLLAPSLLPALAAVPVRTTGGAPWKS